MDRVEMPEVHVPGVRTLNMRDLGNDLCNRELDPPIRSLIVCGANPVVSMPNQRRTREGLTRDNLLTVVHDLFVTDTALYADYVLPATSQIEHLDLSPRMGTPLSGAEPAGHRTRGESVSNTELFRRLARALGRTESWLFESDESMLRAALASGHAWLKGITYDDSGRKGTSASTHRTTGDRSRRAAFRPSPEKPNCIRSLCWSVGRIRCRLPAIFLRGVDCN